MKLAQELTETSNLEFGYDFSKYSGISQYSVTSPGPSLIDKKTNNIYMKYDWLMNDTDQGYLQVYRNKYEYDNFGKIDEKVTGFEAQQAISTAENNKLVVGASYRSSHVNAVTGSYNDKINNKALFVSDQWEFAPSWTLDTGVRYDKHSTAGSKTTWSAGLNKKFDENSHAYFNWGQVFKAPTLDDLYYNVPGMTGNPDLNPEKGDTWTVGYGTRIADKTDVNISYFQSDLEDAIAWSNKSGAWHPENVNKQKKNGMELSINHELNDNWNLEASYTHVRVRNDYGMGYLRDTNFIPNMYRFGVRYHDDLWNADLFLRGGSGADKSAYVDSKYMTLDMSVAYKATKDLSFYAKGYNLFNKAYAESAGVNGGTYTYPAQGRRFIIGAEYTF